MDGSIVEVRITVNIANNRKKQRCDYKSSPKTL